MAKTAIQRIDELSKPPELGKFYLVPAVFLKPDLQQLHPSLRAAQPILGGWHVDPDIPGGEPPHCHPDQRFAMDKGTGAIEAIRLEHAARDGQIVYLAMRCQREAPPFTGIDREQWFRDLADKWKGSQIDRAGQCPHQGVALGSVRPRCGVRRCPAHGLVFGHDGVCIGG